MSDAPIREIKTPKLVDVNICGHICRVRSAWVQWIEYLARCERAEVYRQMLAVKHGAKRETQPTFIEFWEARE